MTSIPTMVDRKTIRTSVLLPESVHRQVQAMADANDVSSAWVLRMAVQRFLDECQGQHVLPLRLSVRKGSNSND